MAEERVPVLVLVGPTAVGKTEAAVCLAERVKGEIVSADSRQIYRGMDVGTAKPAPGLLRRVPHHLIDVADPRESFNAVRYASLARAAIDKIHARGRVPVIVGGSGLYIRALLDGLFLGPPASPQTRAELRSVAERFGPRELHARLAEIDPDSAAHIHPNDVIRLVRALEVFVLTGDSITRLKEHVAEERTPIEAALFGFARDRRDLYGRIDARVDRMMAEGFLDEVRSLMASAGDDAPGLNTLGYRELAASLREETDLDEAVDSVKRNTRRYAKRQITWFSKDPRIQWIALSPASVPEEGAQEILCRL